MKRRIFYFLILIVLTISCREKSSIEVIKLSYDRLKQIYTNSDTSYIDTVGRSNLTTTLNIYINRKTGDTAEFLQDESKNILFLGQRKNGKCIFSAEYYPTGQIQCNSDRNNEGFRNGIFKCYHEDGRIRILGEYRNGKEVGEWKNYSQSGELISVEKYENGIKQ